MSNAYYAEGRTGGAGTDLDYYDGASLTAGDLAFVYDDVVPDFYKLIDYASSPPAESSPSIIAPNTNAGNKRWVQQTDREATNAVKGDVFLATDAEAEAKTNAVKAIVPANLAAMFLDEDNMVSDSNSRYCSQQSIKAYVDTAINTVRDIPVGETILFYKDTVVSGYSLENTLDDKVLYTTKGSADGGQTGGAVHSGGSWTLSGQTVDAHRHTGPSHSHDSGDLRALIGWDAGTRVRMTLVTDSFSATHLVNVSSGSVATATQNYKTVVGGSTGVSGTGNTGYASSDSITSDATWRPEAYCVTMQTRI